MVVVIYNIALCIFYGLACIAGLFNKKAKLWITGRSKVFRQLRRTFSASDKVMWMHCSSLGEFEQGRPLLEEFRLHHPRYKILLTFFSSSGYRSMKDYPLADLVTYIPLDTYCNARRFISAVHPDVVFLIKYDFWYHHLHQARKQGAKLYLVSSIFRPKQIFFRWYGWFWRSMLHCFNILFVQNKQSARLLAGIGIENSIVLGDTRFDRVIEIAAQSKPFPLVEAFAGQHPVLIGGSTWPSDEQLLAQALPQLGNIKTILVPHEIHEEHIVQLEKQFAAHKTVRYTQAAGKNMSEYNVLIVDTVGMLSSIYRYAKIAYIGGGFTPSGIHNTLEAVVYGVPVVFGTIYAKFAEAVDLVGCGAAVSIADAQQLTAALQKLFTDAEYYRQCSQLSKQYVRQKAGATEAIMNNIETA